MSGPSYNNFLFAAKNVLEALEDIGETSCCLVGGMAVRLRGIRREVKASTSPLRLGVVK
jgi:hypothetical protein